MAWSMGSLEDLKELYQRLQDRNIPIDHVSDHGISLGIYFWDSDGNGFGVYYEVPTGEWHRQDHIFSRRRQEEGEISRALGQTRGNSGAIFLELYLDLLQILMDDASTVGELQAPAGLLGDFNGLRQNRYWGLAKTHSQHLATAAAINLVRLGAPSHTTPSMGHPPKMGISCCWFIP